MAMTPPPDAPPPRRSPEETLSERAARELRATPTAPRWIDISTSIISSIRVATRNTWPIDANYPNGSAARAQDTLRISDQILKTALHRTLAGRHGTYPTKVDLEIDDHRCIGAHLIITGRYGDVLPTTGDDIARLAADTLTGMLGLQIPPASITVHFDDITAADLD
jgi:hypothetical protein